MGGGKTTKTIRRRNDQLRAVRITRGFTDYAAGSVLYESGRTRVLCTASFVDELPRDFVGRLKKQTSGGQIFETAEAYEAVKDADIIYTDTWTSMGQEAEKQKRINDFAGYQVDKALVEAAGSDVKIMHCLPAYRGLEITDEVIESQQSIVFDQAENRLHFQRALIKYLL